MYGVAPGTMALVHSWPRVRTCLMERRVLIFDDEKGIRLLLEEIIRRRGDETVLFRDPTTFAARFGERCPCTEAHVCGDVAIVDINMPQMDGFEFVKVLRNGGCRLEHVAIISASWSEEERARARELGCHTIRKPFDLVDLEKWLDECERQTDPSRRLFDFLPNGDMKA